jgi:hypothetical protein
LEPSRPKRTATEAASAGLRIRGVFSIDGFTFKALSLGIYYLDLRKSAFPPDSEKEQ